MADVYRNSAGQEIEWDGSSWVPSTGTLENVAIGAGRTLTNMGRNVQDLYYGATGNDQAQRELQQRDMSERQFYDPLAERSMGATVGEFLPAMATTALTGPAGIAGKLALDAGIGAVEGALTQNVGDSMAGGAGMGATGAVAGGMLGNMAGRVANAWRGARESALDAYSQALGTRFDDLVGKRSPAGQTGSPVLETLEAGASRNPAFNWMDIAGREKQQKNYNRLAARALGIDAPEGMTGINPEQLGDAAESIGRVFNQAGDAMDRVVFDPTDLDRITGNFSTDALNSIEKYQKRFPGLWNGQLTGKEWKHLRQVSAKDMRSAFRNNPGAAEDYVAIQDWLVDLADEQLPGIGRDIAQAKQQWTVLKALERGRGLSPQGDVNAGTVGNALAKNDRFGFGRGGITGEGSGPLGDFYDATRGMNRFSNPIPSSGTGEALMANEVLSNPQESLIKAGAAGIARPVYNALAPMATEGYASPAAQAIGRQLGILGADAMQ